MTSERAVRYRDAHPRGRRAARIVVPLGILVVVAVLLVVAGVAGRAVAEQYIAQRVEQSLPAGVKADVDVQLRGFLLPQLIQGRLDQVDLAAPDLSVDGTRVPAEVTLRGVPFDQSRPVDSVAGTVTLDDAALARLLADQKIPGEISLAGDRIEYRGTAQVLGTSVEYRITARPTVDGDRLILEPQSAELTGGGVTISADELLRLVAPDGIPLCLAESLPEGIALDAVDVQDSQARVRFSGTQLVLTADALSRHGTCGRAR